MQLCQYTLLTYPATDNKFCRHILSTHLPLYTFMPLHLHPLPCAVCRLCTCVNWHYPNNADGCIENVNASTTVCSLTGAIVVANDIVHTLSYDAHTLLSSYPMWFTPAAFTPYFIIFSPFIIFTFPLSFSPKPQQFGSWSCLLNSRWEVSRR